MEWVIHKIPDKCDTPVCPNHYSRFPIQPRIFIQKNKIGFNVGNIIKYVLRAPFKNGLEDINKARQYLDFYEEELREDLGLPPKETNINKEH